MADKIGALHADITGNSASFEKAMDAAASKAAKTEKQIKSFLYQLEAPARAQASMNSVVMAIEKVGGMSNLSGKQVDILRAKIEGLARAGAKIPAAFANLKVAPGSMTAITEALQQQAQIQAQGMAAALGPAGAMLTTLGPAGLAGAVGIAAVTAAAGAATATLVSSAKAAMEYGDRFDDLSRRTHIGAEALQVWDLAASQNATTLDALTAASQKMQAALVNTPQDFRRLGLEAKNLRDMSPEDAIMAVGRALGQVHDQASRVSIARDIFGNVGDEILPAIMAIDQVGEAARRAGLVLSGETVAALGAAKDQTELLGKTWDALWVQLGAGIATSPEVIQALQDITAALSDLVKWMAENREVVSGFFSLLTKGTKDAAQFATRFAMGSGDRVGLSLLGKLLPSTNEIAATVRGFSGVTPSTTAPASTAPSTKQPVTFAPAELAAAAAQQKKIAELMRAAQQDLDAARTLEMKGIDQTLAKIAQEVARRIDAARAAGVHGAALQRLSGIYEEIGARQEIAALIEDSRKRAKPEGSVVEQMGLTDRGREEIAAVTQQIIDTNAAIDDTERAEDAAKKQTFDLTNAMQNLASTMEVFGISADSAMGRLIGGLGGGITAAKNFKNAISGYTDTEGKKVAPADLVGQIFSGVQFAGAAYSIGKTLAGAFSTSGWEKQMREIGRDYGVTISEELAKSIEEQSDKLNVGRFEAALLNIPKIAAEGGKDIRSYGTQIQDLMNAVRSGAVPASEGVQAISDSWDAVRESAEKAHSIGDRTTRQMIESARAGNMLTDSMKEFLKVNAQLAATGAQGMIGKIGEDTGAGARYMGGLDLFAGGAYSTEQAAKVGAAQGRSYSLAFWAMVKEHGMVAAGDAFRDTFAQLRENLSTAMPAGDVDAILGPIQRILDMTRPAGEESGSAGYFRGAAESFDALKQQMEGFANLNLLTQQSMQDLGTLAQAAADQARAGGASQEEVIMASMGYLTAAVNAARNYGIALDPATQKLVDMATAAGYAFPTDPIDKMTSALVDGVLPALNEMIRVLGGVPVVLDDIASGFGNVNTAAGNANLPSGSGSASGGEKNPLESGAPWGGSYQHGTQGFVDFGTEKWIRAHGIEAVIRPQDLLADGWLGRSRSSTSAPGPIQANAYITIQAGDVSDPKRLTEMVARAWKYELAPDLVDTLDKRYKRR